MNSFLESMAFLLMESAWFAPLIAIGAGLITSFAPCSLPSVPLILGYMGLGKEQSVKSSFKLSLMFSVGMIVSSTVIGIVVASIGKLIQFYYTGGWWYLLLGLIMFLMAFQVWGYISLVPSTYLMSRGRKRGYMGAMLTGGLAGVFSSPCATPVLVALLSLVAQNGNILYGGFLLLLYGVGHSVLFILAGTFSGVLRRFLKSKSYGIWTTVVKGFSGAVIMMLAIYLTYLGLA